MAFIEKGIIQGLPDIPYGMSTLPSTAAAFNMTTSTAATACIFPVIKTGALEKIHFRFNASSTGNNYIIRVETVNADGDPSTTLFGANTEVQTGTGIAAGEYVATLNANAVFNTINEPFAITWRASTFSATSSILMYSDGTAGDFMPYLTSSTNYTGGVWAARGGAPMIGLEYDDGTFVTYPGNWPYTAFNTTIVTPSSNPRLVGNRINIPFTARAIGVWFVGDNDSDFEILLYDSNGSTVLKTISIDADFPVGTNNATTLTQYFSSAQTITKNTNYYLVVKSTAGNITNYDGQMITNVPISAVNGGTIAQRCYTSTSTPSSSSDFTVDTDKQSFIGLLYDAIDIPEAGGSETAFSFAY